MVTEQDVQVDGDRTVHVFDSGPRDDATTTILWHHGSPQTGALLAPLLAATEQRGMRLVSYARPSYGSSTPDPGRAVVSAAHDVGRVADALGLDRFATLGASGGGPHGLACAALRPDRVTAVATFAGIAPHTADFDWFGGMQSPGGLRAAMDGRASRARFAETDDFDPAQFVDADWQALSGDWSSLGEDAGRAGEAGPDGLIDDDVAFASAWGFDVGEIGVPALVVQGGLDRVVPRAHGEWLARHLPRAEFWLRPADSHVSILRAVPVALDWVLENADGGAPEARPRRQ